MKKKQSLRHQYNRIYQALRSGWDLPPESRPFGVPDEICECAMYSFEAKLYDKFTGWTNEGNQRHTMKASIWRKPEFEGDIPF